MKLQKVKLNSICVLLFCFTYAIIRYVIIGPVDAVEIPIFILNKAVSWTAVTLLFFSIYTTSKNLNNTAREYGTYAYWCIVCHALLTLSIMNENYFVKLFEGGKLTLFGQLSILSGVLLIVLFLYYYYNFSNTSNFTTVVKRISKVKLILIIALAHLFFLGGKGWITPEKWYGYLPPITLISFIIVLITLFYTYEWKWALNRQRN
jgi:hypothetical protein